MISGAAELLTSVPSACEIFRLFEGLAPLILHCLSAL